MGGTVLVSLMYIAVCSFKSVDIFLSATRFFFSEFFYLFLVVHLREDRVSFDRQIMVSFLQQNDVCSALRQFGEEFAGLETL